jgi:hypothetical protein
LSFSNEIGEPTEWTSLHMFPKACRIVTRTANRQLFGSNLSANEEFLQVSIGFAYTVFQGAHLIRGYPEFLRPAILRWKTNIGEQRALAQKLLGPVFRERILKMQEAARNGQQTEYERTKANDAGMFCSVFPQAYYLVIVYRRYSNLRPF